MIKLIVTDLDGTLLDDDKNLNDSFWSLADKLKQKNILLAIASGRQYFNIASIFEKVLHQIVILAEDGNYTLYQDKELYSRPMQHSLVKEAIVKARNIKETHIVLCGKKSAYVAETNQKFLKEAEKYYQKIEVVKDLTSVEDVFFKVTLCDFKGSETNSFSHFKDDQNKWNVAIAGDIWLDLTALNAHKGSALQFIQKQWQITPEQTLVFGDHLNDIDMIPYSKYSYAMKNARKELIEKSSYITSNDNNNNGVIETINELCF